MLSVLLLDCRRQCNLLWLFWQLRRREDCWSTALVDVYVRDLRPPEQRRKSGGDMAVPRCALRLRYAPGSDPQLAENARLLQELLGGQG
jgi:hypothetical protein